MRAASNGASLIYSAVVEGGSARVGFEEVAADHAMVRLRTRTPPSQTKTQRAHGIPPKRCLAAQPRNRPQRTAAPPFLSLARSPPPRHHRVVATACCHPPTHPSTPSPSPRAAWRVAPTWCTYPATSSATRTRSASRCVFFFFFLFFSCLSNVLLLSHPRVFLTRAFVTRAFVTCADPARASPPTPQGPGAGTRSTAAGILSDVVELAEARW